MQANQMLLQQVEGFVKLLYRLCALSKKGYQVTQYADHSCYELLLSADDFAASITESRQLLLHAAYHESS